MHLHRGGVHLHGFDLDPHDLFLLQKGKDTVQRAVLRPAIHAGIDRVPRPETTGQSAPFATLLGHEEKRVEKLQMSDSHITALARQAGLDAIELRFVDLHESKISQNL
jgi:hypothetical protein